VSRRETLVEKVRCVRVIHPRKQTEQTMREQYGHFQRCCKRGKGRSIMNTCGPDVSLMLAESGRGGATSFADVGEQALGISVTSRAELFL
jgi:hypothetical protein